MEKNPIPDAAGLTELEVDNTSPDISPVKKSGGSYPVDVFKLAGGTAFVQIVTFLASPVISRLFLPEDFGISANFTALFMIISVFVCLRYDASIMLPKTKEEAANQFGLAIFSTIVITSLTIPVLFLLKGAIVYWLKAPELLDYLWLIPFSTFLAGIFISFNAWNSRSRKFLRLSIAQAIRSAAEYSSKIGVGLLGYASGGSLIMTGFFGQIISTLVLGFQVLREDFHFFVENIRFPKMWAGAKRYKKFPLFNTWASLLDQSSQQLPILLLTAFFSTAVAGQYSMGYKILRLPIALIGASIAQVFYQRASKAHHEQNLPQIVKNTSHQLIVFGLFPMLLLTISGRELFVLFLGAQWADAGIYSQILSIWTFFVLISAPMATLFSVLEKNEFHLIFSIVIFITRAISLVIGGLLNNIILAMVLYSITGSVGYIYMQLKLNSMVGIPVRYVAWQILRNILFSLPFLGVIIAVKLFTNANILYVSLTSFVVAIVYYLVLYFYDQSVKDIVTSILTQTKLQQLFKNRKKTG